jgi:hypothetical protein
MRYKNVLLTCAVTLAVATPLIGYAGDETNQRISSTDEARALARRMLTRPEFVPAPGSALIAADRPYGSTTDEARAAFGARLSAGAAAALSEAPSVDLGLKSTPATTDEVRALARRRPSSPVNAAGAVRAPSS